MITNFYRYTASIIFSALLISGCAPRKINDLPYSKDLDTAEQLMQSGHAKQAAPLYKRLADSQSTHQNQYRILAANSLLKSGDISAAKSYVDAIDPTRISTQKKQQLSLLQAQLLLDSGAAEQALIKLKSITVHQLTSEDKITYYQTYAFAASLTGDLIQSARQRIILQQLLQDPLRLYENNAAILEMLSIASPSVLQQAQQTADYELNGWIALTTLFKRHSQSKEELFERLYNWRQEFAQHSANSDFLDTYLAKPQHAFKTPDAIAVLLPESGPYAQAARAIREGLMAAYYHEQDNTFKPSIRFYDTETSQIFRLYSQAVTEGAELIIGPLNKQKIQDLIATTELTVPVLALNSIPNAFQPLLFQFGLNPVDEVNEVVKKARLNGHQKVLIMTPESKLGQRIADYFFFAWKDIGGEILEKQTFNPKDSDFSKPIKQLLNLDESAQRYKNIRRIDAQIKFVPRRRHDVDAIFITGYPRTSRLLNPQLQFYRASRIPVYATPHLYSGRPNPAQDIDLNGISFCDIPWLYNEVYQGALSLETLQATWQQFPSIYLRLIALGIDSYNLLAHLNKLDTIRYQGATGELLLTTDNRIKRHLHCAKFVDSIPQITPSVEQPSAYIPSTGLSQNNLQ